MRYEGVRSITRLVPDQGDLSTVVFSELRRLLSAWREDPDRLGVAVTAYEGLGYHSVGDFVSYGVDYSSEGWSQERCVDAVNASLRGRPRRLLRAQARGLVMALVATAQDAQRARLHDDQVQSAVIECRVLSVEERGTKLCQLREGATT